MIIVVTFKGTNREFLQSPHCDTNSSPTHTLKWPGRSHVQITCNTLSAHHVQHLVLRATWYEGTAQLLSLVEMTSLMCNFHFSVAVCLVGCLMSQLHASVSQGRICEDKFMCCHTEIEGADQTFHLTHSQYTDSGPTSPSTDP